MPFADVNDIRIFYEILGQEHGGTPLVMTHGFAGPSRHWRPELLPFAEKRPLVIYDVRGHHQTTVPADKKSYSMPLFASDLAGLLKAIGIERAHIGGVSMGGMVTAQFAVDFPEMCESVIIDDSTCGNGVDPGPGGDWERHMQKGVQMLMHMVEKYGLKATILRQHEWQQENDPHIIESPYSLDDDMERLSMMTDAGHIGAAHAMLTRPDLTSRIGAITAPTLVMCGAWDDFLPCAERDHKLIAGSRFVVRERCGHGSRWRLETFHSEIEAFLADADAGRPVAGERTI
jgi:pimeloyl-ACP methyl ester carboxylesterase